MMLHRQSLLRQRGQRRLLSSKPHARTSSFSAASCFSNTASKGDGGDVSSRRRWMCQPDMSTSIEPEPPSIHHDDDSSRLYSSSSALLACGVAVLGVSTACQQHYQSSDADGKACQKVLYFHNSLRGQTTNDGDDSFFDMAQQWASENLSEKSPNNEENTTSAKKSTTLFDGPEEFLRELGMLGGSLRSRSNKADDDLDKYLDVTLPPPVDNEPSVKDTMQQYWSKLQESLPKTSTDRDTTEKQTQSDNPQDDTNADDLGIFSEFLSFTNNASSLFSLSRKRNSPQDIDELIRQAQSIANHTSSSNSSSSSPYEYNDSSSISSTGFLSQALYFQQNAKAIQKAFESSFGAHLSSSHINISKTDLFQSLSPTTLHYYLEHEDYIKTPSWKRRCHRFQSDVEVDKVEELNEALILSELSYADSVEEVREGLERMSSAGSGDKGSRFKIKSNKDKPQWELLFCDTESRPNQPSHFLAIQKNASKYDDTLHVLMVVRGTKSMSDLITDAMMEATDYEYRLGNAADGEGNAIKGKAHSGMVQSGKYLGEQLSNKRKLEINLIGHSLGAGAAVISAMEWNSKQFAHANDDGDGSKMDDVKISAHVIGFGCPALLSQQLSLMTRDYVTTVIADADVIPRMSGATLVNFLLDLWKFDYRDQAERDVKQALREVQNRFSTSLPPQSSSKNKVTFSIDDDDIKKVMGYVKQGLDKVMASGDDSESKNKRTEDRGREEVAKMEPVLFPPGEYYGRRLSIASLNLVLTLFMFYA
ncbi:predicted protein [Thalassiosira pseudonana CCMP1335]|uniref:Fungal lipase-type domain-containing protein n=1 Tax=Thalassiosira pseudonana TaxID=35128 RepID=B8C8Y9_THAPS|nr:predicted protein [Thalassiosira pseudonana CCMP1335]EED89758.1 predicted protein [Thalassiosira pseudonana CCMP1335]